MAGQELARNRELALAGGSPLGSVKALLSVASLPSWIAAEAGYGKAQKSQLEVPEQLAAMIMPGGQARVLDDG